MEKIKFKFIDILDSPKKKRYFKVMSKYFLEAFTGEGSYVGVMREILRRKVFLFNSLFRLLLILRNDRVVGGAIYRHWFDYKVSTLEYIFIGSKFRNKGYGALLYKRMKEDLRRMRSKGLFFSLKGTKDLDDHPVYNDKEKVIRLRREKFYKRLGARPLRGIQYSTPVYWSLDIGYTDPFLCYDPLIRKNEINISSILVKKVVKRIMKEYHEIKASHYRVQKILRSIKTQKLRWIR